MLSVYKTEKLSINILCKADTDDLRKMVTSEQLIKDVGRGLSEQSIKLFTEQEEKQNDLLESIKNKKLDLHEGFIVLGARLNENNKFICVMQIVDRGDSNVTQCIVMDPDYYDLIKDMYDAYHTLVFEILNCNYVKCACLKTTIWERKFMLTYGYKRCDKDKSEDYYSYEISSKQYLEKKKLDL